MGKGAEGRAPLLSNWGNHPRVPSEIFSPTSEQELPALLQTRAPLIPRGLGRCYGDSALAPRVLATRQLRGILELAEGEPAVVCRAGTSLGELLEVLVPRGWFLPVVPGTRHVTVGGAIASDIHGKNHHVAGTFSRHVLWMDLHTPNGKMRRVTPAGDPELFAATAGGMGLTGIIVRAALRIVPIPTAYLRTRTLVAPELGEALRLLGESASWPYSVAWIDGQARGRSLGRSIISLGVHAEPGELGGDPRRAPLELPARAAPTVPFHLPSWTLNPWSVGIANAFYYRWKSRSAGDSLTGYDTFFFPLDGIGAWNRIYGRRGFLQYQLVLPLAECQEGLPIILERIAASGLGSFLAVLKLLGAGRDMLSFPLKGYTLALDFPVSARTFALFEELDRLVLRFGGRLYLTKDARMGPTMLEEGYPDVQCFRAVREAHDPQQMLSSLQSRRLRL